VLVGVDLGLEVQGARQRRRISVCGGKLEGCLGLRRIDRGNYLMSAGRQGSSDGHRRWRPTGDLIGEERNGAVIVVARGSRHNEERRPTPMN
jgi:hypothetical protein